MPDKPSSADTKRAKALLDIRLADPQCDIYGIKQTAGKLVLVLAGGGPAEVLKLNLAGDAVTGGTYEFQSSAWAAKVVLALAAGAATTLFDRGVCPADGKSLRSVVKLAPAETAAENETPRRIRVRP